ncbi:MAG TPA: SPOR domain-containing protein [Bacteroidales bacterium]|nr:SPOR domain-containing protein [Bacteroidales bacterium]
MDITAFIRELLFGHDCVIVPGFGGFIGNYTPAQIDKSAGSFYPPVKRISFNRNLNHNDGLLVGKISGVAGIAYGDARNLVDEFVAGVKRKLEKGEKITFDKIGSFVNNHEGNIQFEPDISVNYHLDSYGLESFQCMPLEGYDVRKSITRHINPDPIRKAHRRKVLWRAAVIIPLLTAVLAVPLKTDLFKSKVQTSDMNPLVTKEFEHNRKAVDEGTTATLTASEEGRTEISAETPAVTLPEPAPVKVVNNASTPGYFIITGSFKSEENAVNQVNMLKDEGFAPEIIHASNGFYRVCAMSCTDQATALHRKDSIAEKFPGTWVSRRKQ